MIERIRKLELQIQQLENQKKITEMSLQVAIEMGESMQELLEFKKEKNILKEILYCLEMLDLFVISSICQCDANLEFNILQCSPPNRKKELQKHIDFFIDYGLLALAFHEDRGTILKSQDNTLTFFILPIRTPNSIQGIFIGMLKNNQHIPDTSLSILSLALRNSASSIEAYSKIKDSYKKNLYLEQEVEKKLHEISFQATHDKLTGLANRVQLINKLEKLFSSSNELSALLLLDIDNFREFNDSIGHFEGDNILRRVASRLKKILPHVRLISRDSGDEFAILTNPLSSREKLIEIIKYILGAFKRPFLISGHPISLELSIGAVLLPEHAKTVNGALKKADIAMYLAKKEHCFYRIYEDSMDYFSMDRMIMIAKMTHALNLEKDFYLVYQPKIKLKTESICGAEALIRWANPQYGQISPAIFVPLAERGGTIKKLTMLVIKKAIIQASKWHEERKTKALPIAINLSMLNLQDSELIEYIVTLIDQYNIPAQLIEIEVTESVIMTAPTESIGNLLRLKNMGIKIYIDDFGTGYSTLSYLTTLPVSSLKIDSSFIIPMLKDKHCKTIVETVIQMGHTLGLEVVAEGIEDRQTLDELKKLGCDSGQGYYICKPQLPSELNGWLEKEKMIQT